MSNQLIPVIQKKISNTQIDAVNAKELHKFLNVGKHFRTWITDRISQYEFKENQDFIITPNFGRKEKRGRPSKDYLITLNMAKELSMVERTDKGREARRYFIDCEHRLNELPQKELLPIHTLQTLTPIRYYGLNIIVAQHNNQIWVDFRSVVNAAGLEYYSQARKAEIEIVELGRVEGKLSLISMDNLKLWLEGIGTDRMPVTKLKTVTRVKYEIHPFLTAKIVELSQPVELPAPALVEPEIKDIPPRSIPIIMEEVNHFHPEWIVINRQSLAGDVEFIADELMKLQGKVRQRVDPLITLLSVEEFEDEKAVADFWKKKKEKAFEKLQSAIA